MNLLARIAEILALLAAPADLADETVGELETELREITVQLFEIIDGDDPEAITPEIVMAVPAIADAVESLQALAGERFDQAEQAAAEAAEAEQQIADMLATAAARINGGPDDDPEEPEGDDPEEPEVTPTVEAEAEVAEPEVEAQPEPVAAAVPTPPARTPARPRRFDARPQRQGARWRRPGGGAFENALALNDALLELDDDLMGSGVAGGKARLARLEANYPADRVLPEGRVTDVNELANEVRRQAMGDNAEALVADGGLCAPVEVWYDLQRVAVSDRPVRDSLFGFNARRGGIQFTPPAQLTSIASTGGSPLQAIGSITEAQDAASSVDKTYQTISCGTTTTVKVDMNYLQLEYGNLISRTNPERTTEFSDLADAAFARYNEQRLWTKMKALATKTDFPQRLGATRDLLTGLNRAAVNYRAALRMRPDSIVEVRLPAWVGLGLLPDDQTNALQAYESQFSVDQNWVEARLAERNIRVAAWYWDDFTTAITSGGGLNNYPGSFDVLMNHPGAWAYVDNGILDLGVFRDSTLINNNTFRTFMEEFWNVAMWGVQAWDVVFSLCANGASAGSRTPTCGS